MVNPNNKHNMSQHPQSLATVLAPLSNYIEPAYAVSDGYRSPGKIRQEFDDFFERIKTVDFPPEKTDAPPKFPYAFSAHIGQAARYLDAAKDEYVKAVLAAYCNKK